MKCTSIALTECIANLTSHLKISAFIGESLSCIRLDSEDVVDRLARLFASGLIPQYIRSDNGSEFTSKRVRDWLEFMKVKTLFIAPGGPWENGYIESFNSKLRDELLNLEIFDTLLEEKRSVRQIEIPLKKYRRKGDRMDQRIQKSCNTLRENRRQLPRNGQNRDFQNAA